jgi:hypothetical protein
MARPYSSLVQPLLDAALARARRPATWRDLAGDLAQAGLIDTRAPAELRLAQMTVENMGRRGDFVRTGYLQVPGSRRPMTGWVLRAEPATLPEAPDGLADRQAHAPLEQALRGWIG